MGDELWVPPGSQPEQPPKAPTMDEYLAMVEERQSDYAMNRTFEQQAQCIEAQEMVNKALREGGFTEWTEQHKRAALWACASLIATFKAMVQAGAIPAPALGLLISLVQSQEDLVVGVEIEEEGNGASEG